MSIGPARSAVATTARWILEDAVVPLQKTFIKGFLFYATW